MAILTVGTPGGGVETFNDVDLEGTVGEFKAEVGMRVGMQQFRLHAKLPTGTIPLKIADDSARLSEVGLKDGVSYVWTSSFASMAPNRRSAGWTRD